MNIKEMLIRCILVDYNNIGDNGFFDTESVLAWWMYRTDFEVFRIYNEYYGFEEENIKITFDKMT